jgi:hypothetical protein
MGHALEVIEDQVAVAQAEASLVEPVGAERPVQRALLEPRLLLPREPAAGRTIG